MANQGQQVWMLTVAWSDVKKVPQNSTKMFNVDGDTANNVIPRNQHHKEKK